MPHAKSEAPNHYISSCASHFKKIVTCCSEFMHSSTQKSTQGRRHFHRWWSPSGFRTCWLPLLGFRAARRRFCAWHRHHGEAHRQRPPHVVRGHHKWGGTGLLRIGDGVFQHSKMVYYVCHGASCWVDQAYALGLSSLLSLAVTQCHALLVWPCWMWLTKRIFVEMPHVLENTLAICWKSRNWSIRSSAMFGKHVQLVVQETALSSVVGRMCPWPQQHSTQTESLYVFGSYRFASSTRLTRLVQDTFDIRASWLYWKLLSWSKVMFALWPSTCQILCWFSKGSSSILPQRKARRPETKT